jgi:hypothetical protein
MKNTINETELRNLISDWKNQQTAQKVHNHKLEVAPAYAYLLGAYLSDGHLHWPAVGAPRPKWSGLRDKYFADCISVALHTIGSPHSYQITDRPEAVTSKKYVVYEKVGGKLGWWFDDVAPDKDCLPNIPRELVRPLVAGLMDGDGGIHKSKQGQYRLHYSGDCLFVRDFHALLRSLGVRVSGTFPTNSQVFLNIESVLKAGLCFAMYRKQRHLVGWCYKSITNAKDRGWIADLQRADVAKWYLKNANHLKAGW